MSNKNNLLSPNDVDQVQEILQRKIELILKTGEARAFGFVKKLVTVAELLAFKEIKESGEYKGIPYKDENGEQRFTKDIREFCILFIGVSYSTIQENLSNLETFGQDFFETAQAMKLGYRELAKLRQFPKEDQALIIESEAIDTGDKEAVKEYIEDLAAKHAKEKEALTAQLSDSKAIANARQNLITKANEQVATTTEELEKLRDSQQYKPTDWLKQIQEINFLSTKLAGDAIRAINQLEDLTQRILTEELAPEHSEQALEHLAAVHVYSVDQLFVGASRLSMATRGNFEGYVNKARAMYSEKEILALEAQIIARA